MAINVPFDILSSFEKINIMSKLSVKLTKEFLNFAAIFSDETENFVIPCEPTSEQPVTVKIRTAEQNVDEVYIVSGTYNFPLVKAESLNGFDFYSYTFEKIEKRFSYYFRIVKDGVSYFYNKHGLYDTIDENYNFSIIPNFKTPEWAKGSIVYQIYVDRFCDGDPTNNVVNNEYAYLGKAAKCVEKWSKLPSKEDVCNFYGGDLRGIIDKIDYLKNLGVEVVYLNPIFVSPSNHKYDIQDYDYIDPHLGVIVEDGGEPLYFEKFHNKFATKYIQRTTHKGNLEASNAFFCKLTELLHENGIRVIIDGVFNHCGAFNKWLDKEGFYTGKWYPVGAYREENSPYHDYFIWYDKNWPNNDCYDSWWGHSNHPKLNFEGSKELHNYVMSVGKKWVSAPFNVDGWRLDVAADLGQSPEFNHAFWKEFRKVVKEANPDSIILAEHYGDPKEWLNGDEWDTVMNYDAFMEPITWFLTGMEKHSEEFRADMLCNAMAFEQSMRYFMARFSIQSLTTSMNELSNHDHSRFLTRTNMKVGRLHTVGAEAAAEGINKNIMMEAVTFQMTWPGSPTIYYGDEAGVVGWTDPDNRRTYPWGREDFTLLTFHHEIIKVRKRFNVFKTGSLEYLYLDYGILTYGRFNKDEKIVVALNNNLEQKELSIPVWKLGASTSGDAVTLITTGDGTFSTKQNVYKYRNGYLNITVGAYSSVILQLK